MIHRILSTLLACLFLLSNTQAEQTAPPASAGAELNALVQKITAKLEAGDRTAEALAPELAEFEALQAKYPGDNADGAPIAVMHAMLYANVLGNIEKAQAMLKAIITDHPGTEQAKEAAVELRKLTPEGRAELEAERQAQLASLIGQPAPELTFKWSSRHGLKSLANLKGQVVVLDFWATWCGPCIGSFHQVREHVTHFKGAPVVFLGVTSIQGRIANMGPLIDTKGDEAKEMALMTDFMKAHDMTWDVVFSDQPVFNPAYAIKGIPYVAIIAPDGTLRHAGLHPGNPRSEIAAKVQALLKEFNLPLRSVERGVR